MASECKSPKNLLPDVLFDVFLRLRVRTLCKFSCVCKSWSALISDPFFHQSHHQRSKQNPLLFVATVHDGIRQHPSQAFFLLDKKARTLDPVTEFTLMGGVTNHQMTVLSCIDLVCTYDCHNVYVCNPVTRKWIALPNTGSQYACNIPRREDYAISPRQAMAFGQTASSTPEYKVVRVFTTELRREGHNPFPVYFYYGHLKCEVFTLGSKQWRAVQGPPNIILQLGRKKPTIVNGSVHFLAYCSQDLRSPFVPGSQTIAAFDLKTEEWSVLPIPQGVDLVYGLCLIEAEGLLFLACLEGKCRKLDMWVLEHYDNRMWVKMGAKENIIDYTDCMDLYLMIIELLRNYDHMPQYVEGENYTASLYVESFSSLNIRAFQHKPKPEGWMDSCMGKNR